MAESLPLDGAVAILRERMRQVLVEGYEPEQDRALTGNELAWASFAYVDRALSDHPQDPTPPLMWPLSEDLWKPGDPVRMLVKAGALLAAEIDRRRLGVR